MSLDRSGTYDHLTSPPPTGLEFLEQYGSFVDALIDTSVLRLASVAGTADAITATAEPFAVPGTGLVTGMKFTLVPASNNTGAATLDIDGRGAQSIVNGDGSALNADALVAGTRYILEFDGTSFVIIGSTGSAAGAAASRTVIDTTQVWENGLPANTLVQVELWGAGGGGATALSTAGGGGGGGEYATALYRAGDLPSSVTVTIPSGAAVGTAGGDATFGALLTASGGGGGSSGEGSGGTGGRFIPNSVNIHSGADGGPPGDNGFFSIFGGGGGGGTSGTGGASKYGGGGGDSDNAGQRPGGGGGRNAVGGAGRCIITVFGG